MIILSLIAAILPMLIYLFFLWKFDKNEHEPIKFVLYHFFYGATIAIILGLVGSKLLSIPLTFLFSEEITSASAILLANYVFSTAAVVNVPTAVSYADKYMYFSPMVTATLVSGNTLACSVNGVVDLAGNIQTTASALTCTVTAASLTSLKP